MSQVKRDVEAHDDFEALRTRAVEDIAEFWGALIEEARVSGGVPSVVKLNATMTADALYQSACVFRVLKGEDVGEPDEADVVSVAAMTILTMVKDRKRWLGVMVELARVGLLSPTVLAAAMLRGP